MEYEQCSLAVRILKPYPVGDTMQACRLQGIRTRHMESKDCELMMMAWAKREMWQGQWLKDGFLWEPHSDLMRRAEVTEAG